MDSISNSPASVSPNATGRRQSEEHFSQLVAGVRDYAVFLLDAEGNVLTWNAGAERIKGYRAEEIIGQHFSRFYTCDAMSSGWPAHELKVAAATGRFEDEGWRLRKDGTTFWASLVLTALRDEDGQVRGFLKITRDLTDRKQAEEKLRLSEERFRLLVEGVKDYAIFMLDPEGRVATWNSGAQNLKGYTAAEIIGKHFSIFYPQEALDRDWPADELRRTIELGRLEDEGWRLRKDGTPFWANVVLSALRDERGTLLGFAKVTRDLSDRKKADEKAHRLLQEETARKAAEHAAGEQARQREQLRVTLASIGDGVIVTDADGAVTFLNAVAQRLTGWKLDEAIGSPLESVFKILSEVTRKPLDNPALRALREKSVVVLANHTILVARDGSEVPIEDSAAPIYTADHQISGVVLVFRDVTESRRSLEMRLYLASIVESSDDAIIGKTLDGRIASWNRGAEQLYGYSAHEVIGEPLSLIVPANHQAEMNDLMRRVKTGQRVEHYETVRVRKDGSQVPVSLTVSPVLDNEGRVIGISKIGRDITAQKAAEAQQLKHSRRFRLLWESAAVLLSTEAPDDMLQGLFAKIAPQLKLDCYLNYLAREGQETLCLASHQGLSDKALLQLQDLEPGHGISGNVAATRQTAIYRDIQSSADPLAVYAREAGFQFCVCHPLIVEGRLLGTLAFASCVRKELEPDELEFLHTISQYVAAAYERSRLVQQLKEADRRKDQFLATLAHELRNPLAPLRNGLQVLKMADIPNQAVSQSLGVMNRQLGHMVRLIDDLLDMSRVSQGKITLQKVRVPLTDLVSAAVETSRPAIEQHGHRLVVELPPEALWLDADPTRLGQVISNLLNNASKFTPQGGQIEILGRQNENEVELRVKDNGVGIPPHLQHQVFDVFTQVDRAMERSEGGLGIGLSLVKGLVEMHGGRVEVASQGDSQGSEFIVHLPLTTQTEETTTAEQPEAVVGETPGLRILVVDDNKDSVMTLSMMLGMMRHETRQAYDGAQAVEVAAEYRPDLILMDIGMPGMNGYEACRRMRDHTWGREVTIVALSGWGQVDDKRQSEEAGFDHHLTKPVDPATLSQLAASARGTGRFLS